MAPEDLLKGCLIPSLYLFQKIPSFLSVAVHGWFLNCFSELQVLDSAICAHYSVLLSQTTPLAGSGAS
jgi:hypothetical protein